MGGAEEVICIKEILSTNRVSGTGTYVCRLDAVDDRYYIRANSDEDDLIDIDQLS